jgi:hypothetical protein
MPSRRPDVDTVSGRKEAVYVVTEIPAWWHEHGAVEIVLIPGGDRKLTRQQSAGGIRIEYK